MEKQQVRELPLLDSSGDFLRQNHPVVVEDYPVNDGINNFDESKPQIIKEVDFFSSTEQRQPSVNGSSFIITSVSDSAVNTGLDLLKISPSSSREEKENKLDKNQVMMMNALQVDLKRLKDENNKLKNILDQVTKSYKDLQSYVYLIMQKHTNHDPIRGEQKEELITNGISISSNPINDDSISDAKIQNTCPDHHHHQDILDQTNSESWGSSPKTLKLQKSDKCVEQPPADVPFRKARVSVRARSEAPLISDGCQWRKYGQKMAKGNPCPRAYYRCTMAVGCPVRKQVQRSVEDKTILITTYEGTHNHPLPPSATAMANTTSAAASMLLSNSITSSKLENTVSSSNTNNFSPSFPYASTMAACLSASAPYPTIMLDLTTNQTQNTNSSIIPFLQRPPSPSTIYPLTLHGYPQQLVAGYSRPLLPSHVKLGLGQRHDHSVIENVTAAIASDPNFREALQAAVSAIMAAPATAPGSNEGAKNNGGMPGSPQLPQSCTTFSTN